VESDAASDRCQAVLPPHYSINRAGLTSAFSPMERCCELAQPPIHFGSQVWYLKSPALAELRFTRAHMDLNSFNGSLSDLQALTKRVSCPPVITAALGVQMTVSGSLSFRARSSSSGSATVQTSQDLVTWTDVGK
jgi:hypothetical protein